MKICLTCAKRGRMRCCPSEDGSCDMCVERAPGGPIPEPREDDCCGVNLADVLPEAERRIRVSAEKARRSREDRRIFGGCDPAY